MTSSPAALSRIIILLSTIAAAATPSTATAAPDDNINNIIVVHDLSGRVGPIIDSALARENIARPRVEDIANKFQIVIRDASPKDAVRDSVTRICELRGSDRRTDPRTREAALAAAAADRGVCAGRLFWRPGICRFDRGIPQALVKANAILRLNYPRNTIEIDDADNRLRARKLTFKAVIMVATTRAAAKFIETTHDQFPDLIYGNISAASGSALTNELPLLGPRLARRFGHRRGPARVACRDARSTIIHSGIARHGCSGA
jgi:hypothetical protein